MFHAPFLGETRGLFLASRCAAFRPWSDRGVRDSRQQTGADRAERGKAFSAAAIAIAVFRSKSTLRDCLTYLRPTTSFFSFVCFLPFCQTSISDQTLAGGAAFVTVLALSQVFQGVALRVSCTTPLGVPTILGKSQTSRRCRVTMPYVIVSQY